MNCEKEDFMDKLLSREIKKAVDEIPVPDMDETWNKMKKEIRRYERRKNLLKKSASIAVLLIVFISGVLVGTSNTSTADFWLFNSVKTWYKDTFIIQGSSTENPSASSNDLPTNIKVAQEKSFISLEDASNLLDYTIQIPEYVPAGFTFTGVFIDNEDYNLSMVELYFLENETESYLTIKQVPVNSSTSFFHGVRTNNAEIKSVDINGSEATLIIFENSCQLIWDSQSMMYTITGPVGEEDIVKIGLSLKPFRNP